MRLLVSGATRVLRRYRGHNHLGVLISPFTGCTFSIIDDLEMPFAVDNAAFSGFDREAFLSTLRHIHGREPIFVTAPDVVGDAVTTLRLFNVWEPRIHALGFRVAFVAQDGLENTEVPWDRLDTLFIGGSTEFKYSRLVRANIRLARAYRKWVHMGRVNSPTRIRTAYWWGCNSIDGSGYSRFSEQKIPRALRELSVLDARRELKKRQQSR